MYYPVFKKDVLSLLLERGREGEREGEKHQCVVASCAPPTGDLACNPGMYPDWELNWQPLGLQSSAQSTEPQQSGTCIILLNSSNDPTRKNLLWFLDEENEA